MKPHHQPDRFAVDTNNQNIMSRYMFHKFVQNDRSLNKVHINVQHITLHTKLWAKMTINTSGRYTGSNLTVGFIILKRTSVH